jgi:methyltransferase (TIGR00027 family)
MQVRTRVFDDVFRDFVREPGRQVVMLGAGYDSRAMRFASALERTAVYEVDHPATQERKRRILHRLGGSLPRVSYLPWDFEARPMSELPAALAERGYDARRPTLTMWEGVAVYLSETAVDATVEAVRALSSVGSMLAFTYFDRSTVVRPAGPDKWVARFVARSREPFRFGWDPISLPKWLERRGFELIWDSTATEEARRRLPERYRQGVPFTGRHFALARAV